MLIDKVSDGPRDHDRAADRDSRSAGGDRRALAGCPRPGPALQGYEWDFSPPEEPGAGRREGTGAHPAARSTPQAAPRGGGEGGGAANTLNRFIDSPHRSRIPVRQQDVVDPRIHRVNAPVHGLDPAGEIPPHALDHAPDPDQDSSAGEYRRDHLLTQWLSPNFQITLHPRRFYHHGPPRTVSDSQRPGPSHAPPPPCAGGIATGPGAPDVRNRGSHAASAGRQDGGDPSNRGRAVTRSQRGMPLSATRTIPRSATAVRRRNRGGSWGSGRAGIVGLTRHRPVGKTVATPRIGGGPSRAVSVGCSCSATDPARPAPAPARRPCRPSLRSSRCGRVSARAQGRGCVRRPDFGRSFDLSRPGCGIGSGPNRSRGRP